MASMRDLEARAARLGCTIVYQGHPAAWLARAARAATGSPVVVNCKGIEPDSTPVLITLAELERLQRAAGGDKPAMIGDQPCN
jgi:hypothetical protein